MAPVPSTNISTQCPYNTNKVHLQKKMNKKNKTIETSNSLLISLIRIHTHTTYTTATNNYEKHGGKCAFHFQSFHPTSFLQNAIYNVVDGTGKDESMGENRRFEMSLVFVQIQLFYVCAPWTSSKTGFSPPSYSVAEVGASELSAAAGS